MTDYTNTFYGRAKDANELVIQGNAWDTEYTNIETAVTSKQDKVAGTEGRILELSGTGVPSDSGILSDNLDGLTENFETRAAAAEALLSDNDDGLTVITPRNPSVSYPYFQRAGEYWVYEGDETVTAAGSAVQSYSNNTWLSVGHLSGQSDILWPALSQFTGKAPAALLAKVWIGMDFTGSGSDGYVDLHCANSASGAVNGASKILGVRYKGTGGNEFRVGRDCVIPLDSSGGNFKFWLYKTNGANAGNISIVFHLRGCIDAYF